MVSENKRRQSQGETGNVKPTNAKKTIDFNLVANANFPFHTIQRMYMPTKLK